MYFKVLRWQHAQRSLLRLSENKINPKSNGWEQKNLEHRPLSVGQRQVQWLLHSTHTIYFLAQGPGALPKSLQFVETDCQAGITLDLQEWYFDTGARQQ